MTMIRIIIRFIIFKYIRTLNFPRTSVSAPMMSVVTLLVSLAMPGSCSEETEERLRRGHANVHRYLGKIRWVSVKWVWLVANQGGGLNINNLKVKK